MRYRNKKEVDYSFVGVKNSEQNCVCSSKPLSSIRALSKNEAVKLFVPMAEASLYPKFERMSTLSFSVTESVGKKNSYRVARLPGGHI